MLLLLFQGCTFPHVFLSAVYMRVTCLLREDNCCSLTSRADKLSSDCGFLTMDSSFFSRLSTLLSAPSMITVEFVQLKCHKIIKDKLKQNTCRSVFLKVSPAVVEAHSSPWLSSSYHCCSVHKGLSCQVNYSSTEK
ncbi:hypothetical protein ILYODFUR_038725 [Ilyodon furcidens]|uniref:Secreted protein n=1 Tax=Ilyodon furcidens TaxID=33524 RepID=A0ABV0SSQ8_9TELE